MSGVIKKERVLRRIREQKRGWTFIPLGAIPHAIISQLQSYYLLHIILLQMFVIDV